MTRLPAMLAQSPWLALCIVVLFAAGVLLFEARNLKSENAFTTQLTLEKGNAIITILENALSTESGLHLADNTLNTLVKNLGSDKSLHFLALVDARGTVLMGTGGPAAGERLWDTPPPATLSGAEISLDEEPHFRVSRQLRLGNASGHKRGGHGNTHANLLAAGADAPLWVVTDYDMTSILEARDADRRHLFVIALVLLFLAFLGCVTWYLVRRHLRSLRIAQEATAFSAHILRTLPVGIIAADTDGHITSMNAEALRIIGPPSNAPAPSLPAMWMPFLASLKAGNTVRDTEMRCSFDEGRPIPLAVSASSLITESGQLLGYVFIVRDLGEIRQLQAELRRRDRLAALGTLAAGIAHEVRNPLSAIRGIARYFAECHAPGSEEGELSKTLEQEVLRLDKVVGNLLDLARPDTLQRAAVPLEALIARAQRMAAPALEKDGVAFTAHLPPSAPDIQVDGDRLTQVFLNLFLNAVDAMRQSAVRQLTVRATVDTDADSAWLAVEVEDTGCGIPPEKMQDIFSPYYTTKPRGTGLGLAIVHKIVEAHEGVVEARNSRNGGCVMTVRLPLPQEGKA